VDEAEVEKCVRDVMKEKKIGQKDTGYVWNQTEVLRGR